MDPTALAALHSLVAWMPGPLQQFVVGLMVLAFGSSPIVAGLKLLVPVPKATDGRAKKVLNGIVHILDVCALNSTPFWKAVKEIDLVVHVQGVPATPPLPVPPAALLVLVLSLLAGSTSACSSGQAMRLLVDASDAAGAVVEAAGAEIVKVEQAAENVAVTTAKTQAEGAAAVAAVRTADAAADQAFDAAKTAHDDVVAAVKALVAKTQAFATALKQLTIAGKTIGAEMPDTADALDALVGGTQ